MALVCLVLLTTPVPAEPRDPIVEAFSALRVSAVRGVRVTGFGTADAGGADVEPGAPRPRLVVKQYEADVDYMAPAIRTSLLRETAPASAGGAGARVERVEQAASGERAWAAFATPHGFLKAARSSDAAVRAVPNGVDVRFTLHGRLFVGLINHRNEVDRVWTWVSDPARGEVEVETLFRDYETGPDGVPFPTHLIRHEGGRVALDVWVSTVRVTSSVALR